MTILNGFSGIYEVPQQVIDILKCMLWMGELGGCPVGFDPTSYLIF